MRATLPSRKPDILWNVFQRHFPSKQDQIIVFPGSLGFFTRALISLIFRILHSLISIIQIFLSKLAAFLTVVTAIIMNSIQNWRFFGKILHGRSLETGFLIVGLVFAFFLAFKASNLTIESFSLSIIILFPVLLLLSLRDGGGRTDTIVLFVKLFTFRKFT
jgi:hypothetical protein